MERLKRSFRNSFRRKKSSSHQTESSKPHQWEGDEIAVRNGNCSFPVKYLGCVQVQDSRGMHICEQALLTLKAQKGKSIRGLLYVSGDGLRVVDDETKGLIVDQTIEKVSFCAPDRNHDRGFSYICRDGTTRRWMCHGFLASKDTGDRLSHAVGCSFAVCLERKQKRDAKLADLKSNPASCTAAINNSSLNSAGSSVNNSSLNSTDTDTTKQFSRTGSFRRIPLKQRMKDPQDAIMIEPVPVKEVHNPFAIERPHATPQLLERQGSCRIFKGLNQNSPFKRQLSLRFSTPSQMERHRRSALQQQTQDSMFNKFDTSIGSHFSPSTANQPTFGENFTNNSQPQAKQNESSTLNADLSAMCNYMTENLTMMSNKQDLFADNFQFNQSKSPVITKANITSSISASATPSSDSSFTNNSTHHKTVISVDSNSLFSNNHSSSKSSSPISNPVKDVKKEKLKFGQLSSYSDDFFLTPISNAVPKNNSNNTSTINNKSNGIIFTDLDEPFEGGNFDENATKLNVDSGDQSSLRMESLNNSSMNSLSNSLTSSLNGELGTKPTANQLKMMNNKLNPNNSLNDYLVKEMNHMNHNLNSMNNTMSNQLNNPINLSRKTNLTNLTNNNNIMNKKLNEKDLFDPFNSEWVNLAKNDDLGRNTTNPFLGTTVKAFELKM